MNIGSSRKFGDDAGRDYVFTWVPDGWPHEELAALVERFKSDGNAREPWTCAAHKKIQPGDRAYLLKQRKPIGIFGRGLVVGNPERKTEVESGRSKWQVLLEFNASRGDVLCDPEENFFLDAEKLSQLLAAKTQWQHEASGITLQYDAARGIDDVIGGEGSTVAWTLQQPADEAVVEVVDQIRSRDARQGFLISPKARRAIEERAVQLARQHYLTSGYAVKVVGKPYDLLCEHESGRILYVEVKGTQGIGRDVLLTPNEVTFARDHKDQMALFVVSGIVVDYSDPEVATVSGGSQAIYEPWDIDSGELEPLGYSLTITKKA
jgi:hypothetical protein